ncbi:MAG: hypothetical protein K2G64_00335, partial [Muribaculaceae bacterium]|nr:hypothetical protein [Muribaculaceae bacterium]
KNQKGEYIVVGVDVKNAGRDLEVNAVSTVFGRREDARLTAQEEVIYRSPKITPEQQSLLNGPNSHQYPAARELSESKGREKSAELQAGQEIIVRDSNGAEVKASVVEVKGDKAGVWTAGKLNDRSVKADGAPGYLTEIDKTDIIPDKEELDRSTGAQEGDKPVEATEANKPTDEADGGSNFVGRSLTEAEATEVIGRMEANAETAPELELTIQNWDKLFGETGQVVTPIGEVTMGEHQFAKMMRQGRNGKLGLIKPTLEKPDVIIEQESEAKEGEITSRPSSFIFVKSFIKEDGSRYYHFTSITVSREGKEVVISNQEKSRNKILRLLQSGKIVWYTPKDVTTYSADRQGLDYEQPKNADDASKGSGITPQTMISENKGSETPAEMQVLTTEIAEGSALSRIPVGEDGEPKFEAVDKDTAWDGLVEAVGAEADAADIAMAQVQQATADLDALKKKPPTPKAPKLKGSPMAMAQAKREAAEKYQSDLAEYNQQVADTQARLDAWNGIVGVYTSRNAELRRQQEEARRQRDAEAHDAAVARFEEKQRIKAEKQAEQERVGVHAVNPKIKEKWDNANKIEGNPDAITLPDGSAIRGRYVLTEAGAASASHDVNHAFAPTEGFPIV